MAYFLVALVTVSSVTRCPFLSRVESEGARQYVWDVT